MIWLYRTYLSRKAGKGSRRHLSRQKGEEEWRQGGLYK